MVERPRGGKEGGTGGTLVPPYVAKSFVYLGRAVLGLEGGRGTVLPRPLRLRSLRLIMGKAIFRQALVLARTRACGAQDRFLAVLFIEH